MIFLNKKFLHEVCVDVTFDNPAANEVQANELYKFMRKKKAIGLAANQVGKNIRLFVMQTPEGRRRNCFNPDILGVSEEKITGEEGCLSFPGIYLSIERAKSIKVEYYDHAGNRVEEVLGGLAARCFMHEYDHLNGITMNERFQDELIG